MNQPDTRPTHVRYRVLAFMCVLSFLTYYDRFSMLRAQQGMKDTLGLTDEQLGILIGVFFAAYSLFEIPGGWLGDRFGPRVTLARIVLAWSLFTALTGSATGFTTLLICRFLFGVGEAGAYPNIARVQSAWLPRKSRAWASGVIWLCARWGGALAPLIFGTVSRTFESAGWKSMMHTLGLEALANAASWRAGFWVSGVMGVIWVLLFYPWFRNAPSEKAAVNAAELALIRADGGGQPIKHVTEPGMWSKLLRSPSVWAISMQYFFASCGWSFYASWLQRYMQDVHHLAYDKSEWLSAAPLLLGGISCLVGGMLSDFVVRKTGRRRFGRAIFPVTGFIIATIATFAIRWVHTPQQATVCLCIAAFFFDFGQGANWASIVDIGGRFAGTAAGFLNTCSNSAGSAIPYIAALLFNSIGWNALFAFYACAYLLAASMWLFIDPTKPFYEDKPAHVSEKPVMQGAEGT
jgi:MFS family permease